MSTEYPGSPVGRSVMDGVEPLWISHLCPKECGFERSDEPGTGLRPYCEHIGGMCRMRGDPGSGHPVAVLEISTPGVEISS